MNNVFPYNNYNFQPFGNPTYTGSPQLIKVSGLDGAKAYQMPPNSSVALFHENEDILYVKTTDGAGFPTIRTFQFQPYEEPKIEVEKYVTLDEFNKFKEEFYGKQSVRESSKDE